MTLPLQPFPLSWSPSSSRLVTSLNVVSLIAYPHLLTTTTTLRYCSSILNSEYLNRTCIDIINEDNMTIVHHKVSARFVCVLTEQEAQLAAPVELHQIPPPISTISNQPGSSNGTDHTHELKVLSPASSCRLESLSARMGSRQVVGTGLELSGWVDGIQVGHY